MAALTLTTRVRSLVEPRGAAVVGGVLFTLALTTLVARGGLTFQVEALVGLCLFVVLIAGFVAVPWGMVAGLIPLFAILPMLRFLVSPTLGAVKDVVSLAAIVAAALTLLQRRVARRPTGVDGVLPSLVGLLLALYLVNLGGLLTGQTGHG